MGTMTECELLRRIGEPHPRQREFFEAKGRYIAYGGARGGGKSWAARVKAVLLAIEQDGIQILFLRRTLGELRENHIYPLLRLLGGIALYRSSTRELVFDNDSRIVLGYCAAERDVLQFQGQGYDVIFLEEATQFTEFQFQALTESNRTGGLLREPFAPRMYFTCNPGGVGHAWVKRLFIDRRFRASENPDDYIFIPSRVYDNPFLLAHSPGYVESLQNLPPLRRKAMLDGNWDVFEGQYFDEFDRAVHVEALPRVADTWKRYVTVDYGLDMFACLFIAAEPCGRFWVYREIYESGLIISDAARRVRSAAAGERFAAMYAPPDLFSRRQESGRSAVDIFREHGLPFVKAGAARVAGWYALKELLRVREWPDGVRAPALRICPCCKNLIRTLPALCCDEHNPNDVANTPHELTHAPDALRIFALMRAPRKRRDSGPGEDYRSFLDFGT